MKTKEMIETLRYKANNIKAKIEPEFFNEVADKLEKQIAKKPLDVNVTELKSGVWIDLLCPTCEQSIVGQPYRPNYCKHCGQKLD